MTLELQTLEDRTLMAGNVSVSVASNGDWISILGDGNSNQISITSLSDNDMLITGLSGTTINGYSSWRIDYSAYDLNQQIYISMGNGSDSVSINGLREGYAELNFYGGWGDDYLSISNSQLADVDAVMGENWDTVSIYNTTITGRTERTTGYAGNLTLDGGLGNDNFYLSSNTVNGFTGVYGGDQNDYLSMYNNRFNGNTYAHLGAGNDSAYVRYNSFNGSYNTLDMSSGYDRLTIGTNYVRYPARYGVDSTTWV